MSQAVSKATTPLECVVWSFEKKMKSSVRICGLADIELFLAQGQELSGTDVAAAAAKSLQSCPTLCDTIDGSPPGSPVPGILQARTLEWVAISFSNAWKWKVKVKSLSSVWLLATPWTAAYQVPPSMGFSRQEYWSRVPLPSTGTDFTVCKLKELIPKTITISEGSCSGDMGRSSWTGLWRVFPRQARTWDPWLQCLYLAH